MNITFGRFSVRARRVLSLAQSEAQRLNHSHIEPEHLLLALTQLHDTTAAEVIRRVNASLDQIRMQIEESIGQGTGPTADAMALTPRIKRAIVAAIAAADQMEQRRIGTQHLLLGLLQEAEGVAFEVLTASGVSVDNARVPIPEPTLERTGLIRDAVLSSLRTAILEGTYQAGERLIESALAEQFGTSRVPVRDALKELAREGLVVMRPWRGAFVASSSDKDIE
jgi:ATP-dependent Clp protease ATP-binding subunit ClpC